MVDFLQDLKSPIKNKKKISLVGAGGIQYVCVYLPAWFWGRGSSHTFLKMFLVIGLIKQVQKAVLANHGAIRRGWPGGRPEFWNFKETLAKIRCW